MMEEEEEEVVVEGAGGRQEGGVALHEVAEEVSWASSLWKFQN